jgi:hypothetical protein
VPNNSAPITTAIQDFLTFVISLSFPFTDCPASFIQKGVVAFCPSLLLLRISVEQRPNLWKQEGAPWLKFVQNQKARPLIADIPSFWRSRSPSVGTAEDNAAFVWLMDD